MTTNPNNNIFNETCDHAASGRPPRHYPQLLLLTLLLFCACHRQTTRPSAPDTRAVIFEHDGTHPAADAVVSIFDAGSADDRPSFVKITDDSGRYSLDELPAGIYNVRAEKDSFVLFQDSVLVTDDTTTLRNDTLECPSSLYGRVSVKPDHDSRTVTLRLIGAGRSSVITDLGGSFTLTGLADGDYTLLLTSSFPDYLPTMRHLRIVACSHDTLADTLRLMSRGVPAVDGITITEDTAVGTVKISWTKTPYDDFLDYLIYRETCAAKDFRHAPLFATVDTTFVDSMYVGLRADLTDTAMRCIRYWIVVRTNNQELGPAYQSTEWPFAPKSFIMISPTHRVWNYAQPTVDSASINDTVVAALTAKNRTRPVRSIIWYDPETKDTIGRSSNNDSLAREFSDTIRYTFGSVGTHLLFAIATDNAGARTIDTVSVKIVKDVPLADAGRDTGVFVGEKAYLHGSATQQFGTIVKWEWTIGDGPLTATSSPDTAFVVPATEQTIICRFTATDEDGNTGTDVVNIFTTLKVTAVAAGSGHSLILKSDGSVWGCGSSLNGELGNYESATTVFEPVISDVQSIAAGAHHSLFLKNDRTLWACGANKSGQLGDGSTYDRMTPVKVMDNVLTMAAGTGHTMVLRMDGSLWTCGVNDSGQLGDGTDTSRLTPVNILTDVKAIAAGGRHSLILKNDGTLLACGKNHSGQLGDETEEDKRTPVQVYSDVQGIAAGDRHSLVLKTDGSVWSSGNNWYGQLGDSTGGRRLKPELVMTGVRRVAAGTGFSHFVGIDGILRVSGLNDIGQVGGGTSDTISRPMALMDNVECTAAGESHSLVLRNDGSLWVCGNNSGWQLGDRTRSARTTPIRIIPYMTYEKKEQERQ